MGDINYSRCSNDEGKILPARIGMDPKTGKLLELNVNGVNVILSIQAALAALTAAMRAGHEEDFLEKIVLGLIPKVSADPHSLCPMLTIMGETLLLLQGGLAISCNAEGVLIFHGPEEEEQGGPVEPVETSQGCMFDSPEEEEEGEGEEEDNVNDEESLT